MIRTLDSRPKSRHATRLDATPHIEASTLTPDRLFAHCPRCGAARLPGGVPVECAACGLTLFLNPAVAACAFVFDASGRLLVLTRAHDPHAGKLAVPGGFLDAGETAEAGVRRETREEVGLELGPLDYVGSAPNLYVYKGVSYPVLDLVFRADAIAPESARALDGAAAIAWRGLGSVGPEELAFDSLRFGLARLRG